MTTAIDWAALRAAATAAQSNSYSPYSKLKIGAALLGENGIVYVGCNVENASYGLCQCAERTAIGTAVASGVRRFRACVVVSSMKVPATPCGMCRQTLAEFPPGFPVRCYGIDGQEVQTDVGSLLPFAFTPDHLPSE